MPLMALGMFVFALDPLPFQELQRQTNFRHPQQSRVGARPASQYVGPGDDAMTLAGWVATELIDARPSLDVLREMGAEGLAWPLIDGGGESYGAWEILDVNESQSNLMEDGTPRRIDFNINLRRIEDGDALAGEVTAGGGIR